MQRSYSSFNPDALKDVEMERIEKPRPLGLGFFARGIVTEGIHPPTKLYLHDAGFAQAFRNTDDAINYFLECHNGPLSENKYLNNHNTDYRLGVLWGDNGAKMLDVFGFYGADLSVKGKEWTQNVDYRSLILRNGEMVPKYEEEFCEDTDIIKGIEGIFRRGTKNFDEFITAFPNLAEFQR